MPYTDIVGIDPTIDHVGPMARKTADAALLINIIADPVPGRAAAVVGGRYSRGWTKAWRDYGLERAQGFGWQVSEADVDDAVRRAIDAMAAMGAEVEEVSIPIHRGPHYLTGRHGGGTGGTVRRQRDGLSC